MSRMRTRGCGSWSLTEPVAKLANYRITMSAHPQTAAPKAPAMIPGAEGIRTPMALVAVFVAGVMTETEPHAWQAFLVNFLFFFGVAQGGVMISGAFYLTQAR